MVVYHCFGLHFILKLCITSVRSRIPRNHRCRVRPRCAKSCRGLTETVAGRGTTLQSHAPRQLQTHAYTHAHARVHVHARPQSSCRDVLTRSAQKHRHASGGRRTFQLMSGSFSAVTAKICLPVCGFQKETVSIAHVCATIPPVTTASKEMITVSWAIINIDEPC